MSDETAIFRLYRATADFPPAIRSERWCYHDDGRGGDRMAPHDSSPKLTYEDYLQIPDDGKRHEIVDGVHYVSAAPFLRHQRIARRLAFRLEEFLRQHPLGEFFFAPTDVVLSPHDIVQPDLLFISNERAMIAAG
ncbi:MAG TPA: Uma2 family endonuclease, partial [Thermoanaerobaculia bacterium]